MPDSNNRQIIMLSTAAAASCLGVSEHWLKTSRFRPELDGQAVMDHLGLAPGRAVGEALSFLLEIRLDEGLIGEAGSKARLGAWWSQRSS